MLPILENLALDQAPLPQACTCGEVRVAGRLKSPMQIGPPYPDLYAARRCRSPSLVKPALAAQPTDVRGIL